METTQNITGAMGWSKVATDGNYKTGGMYPKKIHLTVARLTVSVLSPTFRPFKAAQATSVTDGS